jgi:orotate phosphoribosyltransferase
MQRRGLSEKECLGIIESTGAIRKGHFVLTSGNHGDTYVNKDDVSTHPHELSRLAAVIAGNFWGEADAQIVVAPAVGAIALGSWVAYHYGDKMRTVFAEQTEGGFVFRRGYERYIIEGTRALLVEDVITTGKSARAMIEAVNTRGGEVVGLGLLWNRSSEEFGIPVFACVNKILGTYPEDNCRLCRARAEITTDVGHGRQFLDQYGEDPGGWPTNRK